MRRRLVALVASGIDSTLSRAAGRVKGEGAGGWRPGLRAMVTAMVRTFHCPACKNEVDAKATVCSNPECRRPLALCSHCRDVTTYALVEEPGRRGRERYRCDRCQRLGVRCVTWVTGGYCNGLARAGGRVDLPLCASCAGRASEMGRSVLGYAIMGAVGLVLKRRK